MDDITHTLESSNTTAIIAAIAAVLLLLVLIKIFISGPKGDTVLIAGPCDAGKTTLFLQLRDGSLRTTTVASMQPNETSLRLRGDKPSAKPVHVVDIPGHPRLRRNFDLYVNNARGIVFLIDAVDFVPKKTETAEQLYDVLSHPVVAGRRLPILLACNKSDAGPKAHTVDFIRKRLEKEIDHMRTTRGALGGDSTAAQAAALGVAGESFTFEGLATKSKGPSVTCASVSALDTGGVADIEQFIRRCIPA